MTVRCEPADVAIVGLGAGGGVAAHVLARAGLDVVGIEEGPRLTNEDIRFDELRNDVHAHFSQPVLVCARLITQEDVVQGGRLRIPLDGERRDAR